jgi:hypothetical protein
MFYSTGPKDENTILEKTLFELMPLKTIVVAPSRTMPTNGGKELGWIRKEWEKLI